jgi:hypothetical protein
MIVFFLKLLFCVVGISINEIKLSYGKHLFHFVKLILLFYHHSSLKIQKSFATAFSLALILHDILFYLFHLFLAPILLKYLIFLSALLYLIISKYLHFKLVRSILKHLIKWTKFSSRLTHNSSNRPPLSNCF